MNKKSTLATALMLLALTMSSCSSTKKLSDNSNASKLPDSEVLDENFLILTDQQRDYVTRNNDFAFKFFNALSGFDSKVTSPLSASYLLGMLANGAGGGTKEEILRVLEANGLSVEDINAFYKELTEKQSSLDNSTKINIANYVAVNRNSKLKNDFVSAVESNYNAKVEALDFSSANAATHINDWCKKQTDGMIPNIIDNTNADDLSYIMNAIYFNGTWQKKFNTKETKEERFRGYTRDMKRVSMMHQEGRFMYTANETYSTVRLPYGNGAYFMTVMLPNEGKSISDMLQNIDAKTFTDLYFKAEESVVDLKLPRFTTEVKMPLNDIIAKLGAPSIFKGSADFSKFADGNFHISKMLQKAKIEVNEKGTKAAAVTAGIMTMSAFDPEEPKHVNFHADRPFVYVISERSSGAIFFIGQFTGDEL